MAPADDPRPGTACTCGGTLIDPEADVIQGGHPVGGDADYVGSGPVILQCNRCGARMPTDLRRTQYFDGSPTTYS
jgi:hypothetical protein